MTGIWLPFLTYAFILRTGFFTSNKHICLFLFLFVIRWLIIIHCRSQWPLGLRRGSAAARLLVLWVRIPSWEWIFVCCVCCMFLRRSLYIWMIPRPEESYRVCCDWLWSWIINIEGGLGPLGLLPHGKNKFHEFTFRTISLGTELIVSWQVFGAHNTDSLV